MYDIDKIEKKLAQRAKEKQVTKHFFDIAPALKLLGDVLEEDDTVKVEYDYMSAEIHVLTYELGTTEFNMDSWRKVMELADTFSVYPRDDDKLFVEIVFHEVFTV